MAFVFRSPKELDKPIKPDDKDFLYTSEKIAREFLNNRYNKNYKDNNIISNPNLKIPFSSTSIKKPSYFYLEKNPGPGAYDPQYFSKNKTIENSSEDDDNEGNISNLFISREKRFKEINYNKDIPGPGKYYKNYFLNLKKIFTPQKDSGILYKQSKEYIINSKNRKVTIPSKGTNFGYSIDEEGDIKLDTDPEKNKKFNGTYKNSVGPAYYSIENSFTKKNKALDWSKEKDENSLLKKNNKNAQKYIYNNISVQTDPSNTNNYKVPPYLGKSLNNVNNNYQKNITKNMITKRYNKFPNINSIKVNNSQKYYRNNSLLKDKKYSYINQSIAPGPGRYKIYDEFDLIANNKQNQNFGSNKNRGLLISMEGNENILRLGVYDDCLNQPYLIVPEEKIKKYSSEKNYNYIFKKKLMKKNEIKNVILSKIKGIKDQYINEKNEISANLGPGTYNPQFQKKTIFNDIQSFGSISKRFDTNNSVNKNNTNTNKYSTNSIDKNSTKISDLTENEIKELNNLIELKNKEEITKKKFQSQIPKNILIRNINGISCTNLENNKDTIMSELRKSPPVGLYSPEKKLSIEHEANISMKFSEKSPGFGEGEKRFYEKKNKENENLGVGSYNLIKPDKKFIQRRVPFIFGMEKEGKGSMLDSHIMKNNLGPGLYYDNKNDWNIKSFNILFS